MIRSTTIYYVFAGCLQYYNTVNGKIQSFNFDGMIRNLEPCYNGTEPECGQELFTGTYTLNRRIWNLTDHKSYEKHDLL